MRERIGDSGHCCPPRAAEIAEIGIQHRYHGPTMSQPGRVAVFAPELLHDLAETLPRRRGLPSGTPGNSRRARIGRGLPNVQDHMGRQRRIAISFLRMFSAATPVISIVVCF
jgi:hypothetical protein